MRHLFSRSPTALVLGAALAVAMAACDSERAMVPAAVADAPFDARIALQFTEGLDAGLEDAATRLAPSLDDEGAGTTLRAHLNELATYLAAGDTVRVRSALHRAGDVLAHARQGPDAAAIELVLDHAHALLASVRQSAPR